MKPWFLALFAALFAGLPAAQAQELKPGERVLARWKPRDDAYHYPAKILGVSADRVALLYEDGTRARVPRPFVRRRPLRLGDLVFDDSDAAVLVGLEDDRAELQDPFSNRTRRVSLAALRLPLTVPEAVVKPEPKLGEKVWAQWDRGGWWVGQLRRRQGEARLVLFLDGSLSWLPAHKVRSFTLKKGLAVKIVNRRDGQPIDGVLESWDLVKNRAELLCFDGSRHKRGLGELIAELGGPLIDPADGALSDSRLKDWATKRRHFYYGDSPGAAAGELGFIELGLAAFYPKDRKPREGWAAVLEAYAKQSKFFLEKALGKSVEVRVRVYAKPLKGLRSYEWYRRRLRDSAPWLRWEPSSRAARALFPKGPRPGGRCIVAVFPDLPGLSADESGVEGGFGFVRCDGDLLSKVDVQRTLSLRKKPPENTRFDAWRPAYQATTLCHEALHTIGLPHSDSKPWTVMNLGPWHPLTREEVGLHPLHDLVLRSPFKRSLSLSQGWAGYLLDGERRYRQVLRGRRRYDPDFALIYGEDGGFLRLAAVLKAFGPGSACRGGARPDTGERRLLRAYLVSVVDYVVSVYGATKLAACFEATEDGGLAALARSCGKDPGAFAADWRAWLKKALDQG